MKYQISNDSVMIVLDGEPHTLTKGQANYTAVRVGVLAGNEAAVRANLTVGKTIVQWADGEFAVVDGNIHYKGDAMPGVINKRILQMVTKGENPRPLMRFWERLDENPSYRSVEQLYDFLMKHPGIPFTDDGSILFYKGVRADFRDSYSGKFDNSPGQHLKMRRNRVSDDPAVPCHFGFHVGSRQYASRFAGGGVTVICKVDPKDVVCVPNDCSQQKVRVCEYEVLGVDNGGLMSDTVMNSDVTVPKPVTVETDPQTGEPPVNPNEPLVTETPVVAKVTPKPTHTDGSKLDEGETVPKGQDEAAAIVLPLTGTAWDHLNDMDSLQLMEQSLMSLRRYGRHNCLVIGASKHAGGKAWLVPAICKARGYADSTNPK